LVQAPGSRWFRLEAQVYRLTRTVLRFVVVEVGEGTLRFDPDRLARFIDSYADKRKPRRLCNADVPSGVPSLADAEVRRLQTMSTALVGGQRRPMLIDFSADSAKSGRSLLVGAIAFGFNDYSGNQGRWLGGG
jgi:hypothetical protein